MEGKGDETDWDLGPSATMLQCFHLDKFLLKQQNTKELYRTKNKCAHAQLGQTLDKKIQRTKIQLPLLESLASSDVGLPVVLPRSFRFYLCKLGVQGDPAPHHGLRGRMWAGTQPGERG